MSVLVVTVANKYRGPTCSLSRWRLSGERPKNKWPLSEFPNDAMGNYGSVALSLCWEIRSMRWNELSVSPRFYNSHTQDPDCKRRVLLCDRLSSLFQEDVEGLNGITSNLPKDNLLGRSWINLSSCSSAIGCLPYFKVNPNGQNASLSFSLQYPSLDVGQIRRWRYWQWRRNLPLHWSKKKKEKQKRSLAVTAGDSRNKWVQSIMWYFAPVVSTSLKVQYLLSVADFLGGFLKSVSPHPGLQVVLSVLFIGYKYKYL